MANTENRETAELLKESLKIVDKLAKIDIDEMDSTGRFDDVEELIVRAKKLTKHRLWKLR